MRTKILVGAIVIAVAATSVFAAEKYCDKSNGMGQKAMQGKNMKEQHGKKGFALQKMFKKLNLTNEQQTKIDEIMKKNMKNKENMSAAFTKTNFDKAKFIEFASKKRENMIKSKADMIEAIYAVLTGEQKLQLKVLMDLKMNRMSTRVESDKYSYGRG